MSEQLKDLESQPAPRKKSRLGRLVAWIVWIGIFPPFAVMTMGSVIAGLYGDVPNYDPAESHELSRSDYAWCTRRLVGLRNELEGQVTLELQYPREKGEPLERWDIWHEGWTDKLGEARARCQSGDDSLARAFGSLDEAHAGYKDGLVRIVQTRHGAARDLRSILRKLKPERQR